VRARNILPRFDHFLPCWQTATLWLRSNLIVRIESPIAREHEAQFKASKEKKARESVPHF